MEYTRNIWLNKDDDPEKLLEDIIKGDLPLILLLSDKKKNYSGDENREYELTFSVEQVRINN